MGTRKPSGFTRCCAMCSMRLSVPQRLSYERELVVLQVAQTAVDQTRRPLRRPAGDVAFVQEQHPQTPHRGVPGHAGAVYAGPDHDEIEVLPLDVLRYA